VALDCGVERGKEVIRVHLHSDAADFLAQSFGVDVDPDHLAGILQRRAPEVCLGQLAANHDDQIGAGRDFGRFWAAEVAAVVQRITGHRDDAAPSVSGKAGRFERGQCAAGLLGGAHGAAAGIQIHQDRGRRSVRLRRLIAP
jgi:hypothetical protein